MYKIGTKTHKVSTSQRKPFGNDFEKIEVGSYGVYEQGEIGLVNFTFKPIVNDQIPFLDSLIIRV